MQAICILMGIPEADRHQLLEWIEHSFDFKDDREAFETTDDVTLAAASMFEYGTQLIARETRAPRRRHALRRVQRDAPRRGSAPAHRPGAPVLLQPVVGRGSRYHAQCDRGGDRRLRRVSRRMEMLRDDPAAVTSAIEEIVRWTHPAAYNRRTATRSAELAGHEISAGDKVVFWEASANRDELVFAEPVPLRRAPAAQPASRLRARRPPLPRREPRTPRDSRRAHRAARARRADRLHRTRRVDAQQQAHGNPAAPGANDARVEAGIGRRDQVRADQSAGSRAPDQSPRTRPCFS